LGEPSARAVPPDKLIELFRRIIVRRFTIPATLESAENVVTVSQLRALRYLERHSDCTMGALASGLGISQPAATKLVDRLGAKNLADRHRQGRDRRQIQIRLTPEGRRLVEVVQLRRQGRLRDVLESMAPDRRASFLAGVEEFVRRAVTDAEAVKAICLQCGTEHTDDCLINQICLEMTGRPVNTG